MRTETWNTLNEPKLISVRHRHFERLHALFAGESLETVFVLNGIGLGTNDDGPDWEVWLEASLETLAQHAQSAKDTDVFRPLCLSYDPHGVHFIDDLFGAEVFQLDGGGWQVRPLTTPVGRLETPDLESRPSWRAATGFARAFVERDVAGVILGLPTIASPLNIAVNLYGQRILEAMLLEPEAAKHDLQVINDLLCAIHRWYRQAVPPEQLQCVVPTGRCQPPEFGQLCGCTTQLLSEEQYAEFIAPLDDALLSVYPSGGMIHLCGGHTQHIPIWREMKALRAVQMNDQAAEELEAYFCGLREDQILYVNPCEGMSVERIVEITDGQRLVLPANISEPIHLR